MEVDKLFEEVLKENEEDDFELMVDEILEEPCIKIAKICGGDIDHIELQKFVVKTIVKVIKRALGG